MWRWERIWQTYCCVDDHVFRLRGRDRDHVVLFFGLFLLAVEPLARWQGQAKQGQHNGPER